MFDVVAFDVNVGLDCEIILGFDVGVHLKLDLGRDLGFPSGC